MNNPRKLAADALLKIEVDKAYSNLTLNNVLSKTQLSSADKSLCTSIFYGVLDRKITLDYVIKKFISTPIKKIKPYTLTVLRCGIYQIMYMDRIPNSAVLADGVDPMHPLVCCNSHDDEAGLFERAEKVIEYLREKYKNGEKVVAVSHAAFITFIVFLIMGFKNNMPKFDISFYNTGITRIIFYKEGTNPYGDIVFEYINDTTHLK